MGAPQDLETQLATLAASLGSTSSDWEVRVAGLRKLGSLSDVICQAPGADAMLYGLHSPLSCQVRGSGSLPGVLPAPMSIETRNLSVLGLIILQ